MDKEDFFLDFGKFFPFSEFLFLDIMQFYFNDSIRNPIPVSEMSNLWYLNLWNEKNDK